MRTAARFVAFLCAVGFVFAATATLLILCVRAAFINPETYKSALSENQIYDRLPGVIAGELVNSAEYDPCEQNPTLCEGEEAAEDEADGPPAYIENLDAATWESILTTLAPPSWLKAQTNSFIDQIFDLDRMDEPIEISLVELKHRITGPEGPMVIRQVLAAQPPCSTEQIADITHDLAMGEQIDTILACRPPDELLDEWMPSFQYELQQAVAEIPEVSRIPHLLQGIEAQDTPTEGFVSPARVVDFFRWSPLLSICPALLLLLAAAMGARSLPSLLKWWGWPLLLTGLVGLGLGLSVYTVRSVAANQVVGAAPTSFQQESVQLVSEIFHSVMATFASYILIASGAMFLTGVSLSITAMVLYRASRI